MGKSRKHHSTKGALPRKKIGRSTLAGKSAGWIDICAFLTMGAMEQAEKIRRGMAPSTISALSDEILKIPRHRLLSKLKLPARLVQRRTTAGRRLNPFE